MQKSYIFAARKSNKTTAMTTFLGFLNTPLLVIILVFALGICLFLYKHSHHHDIAADEAKLRQTIETIFKEADRTPISQNRLIRGLKEHYHVNEKVALLFVSKARQAGIIRVTGTDVELA